MTWELRCHKVISEESSAVVSFTIHNDNRELKRSVLGLDDLLLEMDNFSGKLVQVGLVDALNDVVDHDFALSDLVHAWCLKIW
jgi:hypothetical protein